MNKKAQMKMMENIAIMIIFFLLVALGLIFYSKLGGHSAQQNIEKFAQQNAVKLAQVVSSLPEVRCSEENVPVSDCYDLLRLDMASQNTFPNNNRYYFETLGYSKISVEQIYPPIPLPIEVYDNVPTNRNYNYIPIFIPITLYNATINQFHFGVLEVGLYD
jgi:hypothetical protein